MVSLPSTFPPSISLSVMGDFESELSSPHFPPPPLHFLFFQWHMGWNEEEREESLPTSWVSSSLNIETGMGRERASTSDFVLFQPQLYPSIHSVEMVMIVAYWCLSQSLKWRTSLDSNDLFVRMKEWGRGGEGFYSRLITCLIRQKSLFW